MYESTLFAPEAEQPLDHFVHNDNGLMAWIDGHIWPLNRLRMSLSRSRQTI